MYKYLRKLNRFKKLIVIFFVVFFLMIGVIPLIINSLYKFSAPFEAFTAEWSAGEALVYYGSVLTFLSTTILSVLALWQNHIIKTEHDKHTAILERMEKEKNWPHLVIENITIFEAGGLTLFLKNVSENIAQNINISGFCILNEESESKWNDEKNYFIQCFDYLQSKKISLATPKIESLSNRIVFDIYYFDIFNEPHNCKAIGHFVDKMDNLVFKIVEQIDK